MSVSNTGHTIGMDQAMHFPGAMFNNKLLKVFRSIFVFYYLLLLVSIRVREEQQM